MKNIEMENGFTSMMDFWQILLWVALVFFFISKLFQTLYRRSIKNHPGWLNSNVLKKLALASIAICISSMVILILSLIWAGVWWIWDNVIGDLSPGRLALMSLLFGPSPILLSLIAVIVAKLIGGTLDASRADNCIVLGVDIGSVLYAMFMAHWLTIFTGGLAVIGLMVSGVWATINLF